MLKTTREVPMRALTALPAIVLTAAASPALAQPMHEYGWGHMGWGFPSFLFWLAIIAFVWWAMRRGRLNLPWFDTRQGAMNILRERYARGEISAEEYQERKKHLSE
jgi:putative membrane protein